MSTESVLSGVENLLSVCDLLDTEARPYRDEAVLGTSLIRHLLDNQPLDMYDDVNVPETYMSKAALETKWRDRSTDVD